MDAQTVASKSLNALFKHKKKITPGFINRLLIAFAPLIPSGIIVYLRKHTTFFSNQME